MSLSTFFHSVFHFFENLGHSNKWEKAANATIGIIGPLTERIVEMTAGEAAAGEVKNIISQVQNDLGVVAGVVGAASANNASADPSLLSTVFAACNSVKSNLSGLLAAGHVKDTATMTKVTSTVNTIVGEIDAIAGMVEPR